MQNAGGLLAKYQPCLLFVNPVYCFKVDFTGSSAVELLAAFNGIENFRPVERNRLTRCRASYQIILEAVRRTDNILILVFSSQRHQCHLRVSEIENPQHHLFTQRCRVFTREIMPLFLDNLHFIILPSAAYRRSAIHKTITSNGRPTPHPSLHRVLAISCRMPSVYESGNT